MRLRAKTLTYWKGHFVAEGAEFEASAEQGRMLIASGIASEVSGGTGVAQHTLIDINSVPDPVANLRPAAPKRKPRKADPE